jgi:hypothetical protein
MIEYRIELGIAATRQFDKVSDRALAVHQEQNHALAAIQRELLDLLRE